ncbi:YbaK/EbsC family protein [Marinactinospora rubrisoli]|uniref:YbaK/EbsC family protein n=1 Tax=Marinactinospora rubrisoli TaxID=2715399 RepID=A0ABW2KMM8_9ACTN
MSLPSSAARPAPGPPTQQHRARYRLGAGGAGFPGAGRAVDKEDHAPEGRTEAVSALRGHPVAQAAAKCIVVMLRTGKWAKRHVLAVVPGDARVDMAKVKALAGGTYASFAAPDTFAAAGTRPWALRRCP